MNHSQEKSKRHYKRTIRNNKKLERWKLKKKSDERDDNLCPDVCGFDCNLELCLEDLIDELPDMKTGSKIKWIQKTSPSSRYHTKCKLINSEPKFKRPKVKIHKTLQSVSCCACPNPKEKKFKNECYCHEPLDKPILPIKPVITKPNPKGRKKKHSLSQGNILHNIAILHKAKQLLHDYVPESAFLKSLQKEAKEVYDCQCTSCKCKEKAAGLKFTKCRKLLEDAYKEVENEKQQLDDIVNRFHKCGLRDASTTVASAKSLGSVEDKINNTEVLSTEKIQEVKQIRDENYFDTHSTNVSLTVKDAPPHKCIHKFILDHRLLPKPLNADSFGVSRCIICNKAMESNEKKDYTTPKKVRKKKPVLPKAALISPRKINFASRNDIVELKVPSLCITDQTKDIAKVLKCMKAAPANSWALRYQKGVI